MCETNACPTKLGLMANVDLSEINLSVMLYKSWIWVEMLHYVCFTQSLYESVGSQIVSM